MNSKCSDNLVSLKNRSQEERKKISSLGGKKSGETRRRRKALKNDLEYILSRKGVQKLICTALIQEAINGNSSGSVVRAFEVIRDTLGEKPVDNLQMEGGIYFSFDDASEDYSG